MFTDGAATSATGSSPVFSSASYNFVAGDVGAWVYIGAGTNWTKGWYQIASVAANAATLSAALGAGVLDAYAGLTTVAGCATTASPTGATWTIDYSQQNAAQFSYTDLTSVGTGLTVSSSAKPFGAQQVGNVLVVTSGTNFNVGRYVVQSVSSGTATLRGLANITTGAGVSGVGGLGGALASPGRMSAIITAVAAANSSSAFIAGGTYTVTTASTNVDAGCMALPSGDGHIVGYTSVRTLVNFDTQPIIKLNAGLSSASINTSGRQIFGNIEFDGNAQATSKLISAGQCGLVACTIKNFTGAVTTYATSCVKCYATGCSGQAFQGPCFGCVATANTASPFVNGPCAFCVSYANTGASTDGFDVLTQGGAFNCVAYGNGRDGFKNTTAFANPFVNCIAEANSGYAFGTNAGFGGQSSTYSTCATYNNTSGVFRGGTVEGIQLSPVTGSASFFTNAPGGDFSLNNTAGAGALLRAAGFPGLMPGGLTTGYLDIGVAQHADSGGSAGLLQGAGMTGGFNG